MTEPIRWVQTNLRETDTALDPGRLVNQLVDFRANCLLVGMGGIVAHYPTRVEHHIVSPHLPPGAGTLFVAHSSAELRLAGDVQGMTMPRAVHAVMHETAYRWTFGSR